MEHSKLQEVSAVLVQVVDSVDQEASAVQVDEVVLADMVVPVGEVVLAVMVEQEVDMALEDTAADLSLVHALLKLVLQFYVSTT